MNQNQIISTLRGQKELLLRNYHAEVKAIFGSYARGDQNDESDLDVLVHFRKGATLITLASLSIYLSEILDMKVDVVSDRALKKELQSNIQGQLIEI